MPRKHILCFDGTWNHPDDEHGPDAEIVTNARRVFEAVLDGPSVRDQVKWYDEGIGMHWYDRFSAGAFGLGVDYKIQEGYRYLAENHLDGDRVYLFGYSRGAYSARSLVGLIRKCGLLLPEHVDLTSDAYELYRMRHDRADCPEAIEFRRRYAREIDIQFLGVFDTVGSLGIPLESFAQFNRESYEFHDVNLSSIVHEAYHALALDEHREVFNVTLWDPDEPTKQTLEQRWFVGSHADVGGGSGPDRRLSDLPLRWMIEKALAAGLIFDPKQVPLRIDRNHLAPVTDSYSDFLGGAFSLFVDPFFRPVGRTYFGNELLDDSVIAKLDEDAYYHPVNRGVFVG